LEAERARLDADKTAAEKEKLEAERVAAEARAPTEKPRQQQAAVQSQSSATSGAGGQYQVAANLESEGKGKDAIRAYIQAARGGNCQAAMRLGEIYDKGLMGIARDYAESLKWYNAARVLGCDVPLP